jgi:predicted esterase
LYRTTPTFFSALVMAALAGCGRDPSRASPATDPDPAPQAVADGPPTPWCGEGWRVIDASTCLALPSRFAEPPSLVIFAHGILAPQASPAEDQATLLAASRELGFAVLVGRGKQGLCAWQPDVADHYCWPTAQAVVDEQTPAIAAAWSEAQGRAEGMAGVRFARRYLVGFSNGGYFTAFVSTQGLVPLDGAAVVGAGRTVVDESLLATARPPIYLAVGDQEADVTRHDAATLASALTQNAWPVKYVVHAGRGHELRGDDLASAWEAWGR